VTSLGGSELRYERVEGWAKLPAGWTMGNMGLATDVDDHVFAWNRSAHPMIVFDRDGHIVDVWSETVIDALVGADAHPAAWRAPYGFIAAHGMYLDAQQHLYFSVHMSHVVLKTDRSGKELLRLGEWDTPSNPEFRGDVQQYLGEPTPGAFGPFCVPTDVAVAPDGSIFVSDGYGNARVHHFTAEGALIGSFGAPGKGGQGRFHLPHGIWVDRDERVLVADRLNHRIQVFSADGTFLDEWTDVLGPSDIFVDDEGHVFVAEAHDRRLCSILDLEGNVLARLKDVESAPWMPSTGLRSQAGHSVWVDSEGSIYLNNTVADDELVKYVRV
jgi:DNA-binding beta-propeller fold protein YncE